MKPSSHPRLKLPTILTFVCTQSNDFMYYYQTLIILFSNNHLFAHSEVVSSTAHINSFICIEWNGFKYSYLTLTILHNTIHLHTIKWFQVFLKIILSSINHLFVHKWLQKLQSKTNNFISTHQNDFKHCCVTLTIQFNTSHLFAHS